MLNGRNEYCDNGHQTIYEHVACRHAKYFIQLSAGPYFTQPSITLRVFISIDKEWEHANGGQLRVACLEHYH